MHTWWGLWSIPVSHLKVYPSFLIPTLSVWRAWFLKWKKRGWLQVEARMDNVSPSPPLDAHNKTSGNLVSNAVSCDVSPQRSSGLCNRTFVKWVPACKTPEMCFTHFTHASTRRVHFLSTHVHDLTSREARQRRHGCGGCVLSSGRKYLWPWRHSVCRRGDNNASPLRHFREVTVADSKIAINCDVDFRMSVCVGVCRRHHLSFVVIIMSVRDGAHAHTW